MAGGIGSHGGTKKVLEKYWSRKWLRELWTFTERQTRAEIDLDGRMGGRYDKIFFSTIANLFIVAPKWQNN